MLVGALIALLAGASASQFGNAVEKAKSKTAATSKASGGAKLDAAAVARGKLIFDRATCAGCHPGGGNALMPSKPLKGDGFAARYKDDTSLSDAIRVGFPEDGMPPFPKAKVSDKDMKDLICYLRSLTKRN